MPIYEYACEHGYETEEIFPMGEAPVEVQITHIFDEEWAPFHAPCLAGRVYSFHHQEDRRHMRTGISAATGRGYAQSRTEERVIEKTTGIEFVQKSEMPPLWKKLGEYARHVKAGGERLDPDVINPPENTSLKGAILKKIDERGIRFGA